MINNSNSFKLTLFEASEGSASKEVGPDRVLRLEGYDGSPAS